MERKMAATELHQLGSNKGSSGSDEEGAQVPNSNTKQRGGWITMPFIIGAGWGLNLASGGWLSNLIVYLIKEFNMKSIDAAQVSNVINGCTCLFPIIGAIIADSFLGSFVVVSISSCISFLGILLLVLTASITSLRPKPCEIGSSLCKTPSGMQYAIIYTSLALASLGMGGTRFVLATMGADQLDEPNHQEVYFNWYFLAMCTSLLTSATFLVYIQDNFSWTLGFGLALMVNVIALVVFLFGKRFYRLVKKAEGSPFVDLARVIVATFRKRKVLLSSNVDDYYNNNKNIGLKIIEATVVAPTQSLRFLNRAALKTEKDKLPDGSITETWRLCTVQQVEDFKALARIFPLWSTGIFLSTPIAVQIGFTVLQALSMNRHLGPHFQIPAGSFSVVVLISSSLFLSLVDRFLIPTWQKVTGQYPTPLQRIGIGHVLIISSMAVSAIVEAQRLKIAKSPALEEHQPGWVVPMLGLWLFPQLVLVGLGEAFHFPGQLALYYQEFPASLKNTATAMIALLIGIAFYLSTALIDLVRRTTGWLPDDINDGRLDNVYWLSALAGAVNFGYYLVCAKFYKYQNVAEKGLIL